MGNLHAVAASAVAIPATTETIIATMTPFNEREASGAGPDLNPTASSSAGGQGIYLGGSINIVTTSATTVTVKVYRGTAISAPNQVGVSQVVSTAVSPAVSALDIGELDPTLVQLPANYIVTVTTAAGTATVNRVLFTAEEASAYA